MTLNLTPRWTGKTWLMMQYIMNYLREGHKLVYLNKSKVWVIRKNDA